MFAILLLIHLVPSTAKTKPVQTHLSGLIGTIPETYSNEAATPKGVEIEARPIKEEIRGMKAG